MALLLELGRAARVAVLGGGLGACSFAHEFARLAAARGDPCQQVDVTLFDMGRSVGGRLATRGSREWPGLAVAHGAPGLHVASPAAVRLCESFAASGDLVEWSAADFGRVGADGTFFRGAFEGEGPVACPLPAARYFSGPLCECLVAGAAGVSFQGSTMVQRLERWPASEAPGGVAWRLTGKDGAALGDFDYLVVGSTAPASPRWTDVFGGPPPLVAAAAPTPTAAPSPGLDASLAAIAGMGAAPVTAVLLAWPAHHPAAAALAALPFRKLTVATSGGLERVVVGAWAEAAGGTGASLVLHSTAPFSRGVADVFGATSTAAKLGAASSSDREREIVDELIAECRRTFAAAGFAAAAAALPPPARAVAAATNAHVFGPHLHRWGAAFPTGAPLAASAAAVPDARVLFCGDYVATPPVPGVKHAPTGTAEAALLSGIQAAATLSAWLEAASRAPRL